MQVLLSAHALESLDIIFNAILKKQQLESEPLATLAEIQKDKSGASARFLSARNTNQMQLERERERERELSR
jgi:hypothetical protein